MEKITFKLDGEQVEADPGTTILDAAKAQGKFIPTFCHNKELKPFASCFVCVVEVEGRPNLIPSCSTLVMKDMNVLTQSERVVEARRTCVELLLSDHLGDCLGPCMTACPAGIDIPGFVKHLALGEDREALELIKHNMPLPGLLGRVCTRPCETACRRQLVEEPIAICQLKRYPADVVSDSGEEYLPVPAASTGKKIAIVGAGPAGLTAAYYLQLLGHSCTVLEAHEAPGGMTRYGIPSYRLPRDVIDREVEVIEKLGATFQYNKRLGSDFTLDDLRQNNDAVFLGLGAQKASSMRVEGEDLDGVLTGIGFLGEVAGDEQRPIGKRVMVVGGGNTAIDAARTALRLGSAEVTILYRRTRVEMPAWEEEIVAAEEEGINLEILAAPTKVEKNADGSLKVTCIRMELGEPDASGRRRPMPIDGSEHDREYDNVIAAIGQGVDATMAGDVELERWGNIHADPHTMQTSMKDVFSGGDCVTGADIAVNAVAAGRKAAISIDQLVMGREVVGDPHAYNHTMGELDEVPTAIPEQFDKTDRNKMPHLDPVARAKIFDEVETGFSAEQVKAEAERCMECGCRDAHECRLRSYASWFDAEQERYLGARREYEHDDSHESIVHDAHKCIQCGTCVRVTDELLGTHAMGFVGRGFTARVKPAMERAMVLVEGKQLEKIVENCPVGALTYKKDSVWTLDPEFKRPAPRSV
ncbi:MAG: FAD-dependent oxidoreductase [Deltaproteobacteria bacterium]|nr:FAD-dependent oxidoreductase [Deltaproteobacteria bacterium]